MRAILHFPHWHLSPAHLTHVVHADEDAAVGYLLLGFVIVVFSVAVIYLYSAAL